MSGRNRTVARMVVLAMIVALGGCNPFQRNRPPTEIKPSAALLRDEWQGSLITPSALAGAMQIRGSARWSRDGAESSVVTLTISNATAGGVHPWHVHRGRCGDNGPIVGDAALYKPLAVDATGTASANARLNVPLPGSGDYYVNVHALASNMGTIVSCGNLAPPVS